ncbi:MAG: hypothetical protein Q4F01_06275 [Staphylococcus rostri]|uniref:hypothetical protein n=1 Tax=Staphylococcus rostri TaxID=522262 RepID=UPI0026E03925|nr:hypothetical protein [Staphylococcus rostri]MDO5375781.1 hypothetical protein [Staphylococcus rostri]
MAMGRLILIWLVLLIFNIVNSISLVLGKGTLINISPWLTGSLFLVVSLFIIGLLILRKHTQQNFTAHDLTDNTDINLEANEFFFQLPLYIVDKQVIPIYGGEDITYSPYYFNRIHQIFSLLGFYSMYSTHLQSNTNSVKIIAQSPFTLRYKYNVYLNDDFIGTYEMRKLLKEKGIKQQLPYVFYTKDHTYSLKNDYMRSKTTILNDNGDIVLQANKRFWDLAKDKHTKKRGEKHTITINNTDDCPELFLALYIQAIINRQTQESA